MRLLTWLRFRRGRADAMACREAVALLSDHLDDALSPDEQTRLVDHLRSCTHCAECLEQIRATIRLAGKVDPGRLDPTTRAGLTDLYRTWQQGSTSASIEDG